MQKNLSDLFDTPVYDEDLMDILLRKTAENIIFEMNKQEISIRKMSEITGITFPHLSRIFNGHARMGLQVMIKLAYALHVHPGDLFAHLPNEETFFREYSSISQDFENLTQEIDYKGVEFLYKFCENYVKEYKRLEKKSN